MPNKISDEKCRVSITMQKELVARIDKIAEISDRDRTYVIRHLVENGFSFIDGTEKRIAPEIDAAIESMQGNLIAAEPKAHYNKPHKTKTLLKKTTKQIA